MIKGVKPTGKFNSGEFTPTNKSKYIGTYPIIYRSGWEKRFCIYCDLNDKILKWASEPFEIPYYNPDDKKVHRYYPDFYFEALQLDNSVVKYVAEIKPNGFLSRPKAPSSSTLKKNMSYNYQLKRYIQIISKKNAATKWAAAKGYKYIFVTENAWGKLFK